MARLVVSPAISARGFSASTCSETVSPFHTAEPSAAKGEESDGRDSSMFTSLTVISWPPWRSM